MLRIISVPLVLERILVAIKLSGRLVVCNVLHAEIAEYGKERLSCMAECNGTVMRIMLRYQYVAVEPSHLRDGEHADAAERMRCNRQYLALCKVCMERRISCTLQAEE